MDKEVSVPETLNALRLAVNAAESKIINYMSCADNCEGMNDVSTQPSFAACNRPMVAKYLKSKSDDVVFKQDDVKVDPKKLGLSDSNNSKQLKGVPPQRVLELPHKQKMTEGFVPAWRRKSLDDINRIKNMRRGVLSLDLFEIKISVTTVDRPFLLLQRLLEYPNCRRILRIIKFKPGHIKTTTMRQHL
jgi:hypothetical protein